MKELDYDIYLHYPVSNTGEEEQVRPATTDDWALEFKRYLEIVLERIMHKRPSVLDSHTLEADVNSLASKRPKIFERTGVFVIVASEESYENETYQNVLEDIFSTLEKDDTEKIQRIFKVELQPPEPEKEHIQLQHALSYEFFEKAGLSKKSKTMNITEGNGPPDAFWAGLLDLSYDLINALSGFYDQPLVSYTTTLYLAETTPDQQENYNSLKREFLQQGIKVYPDRKLPVEGPNIKKALHEYLDKCNISVHIIGERYGDYVPKSEYSMTELQNRIVDEYCAARNDFEKVIFTSQKARIRDGKQKLFLERLRKNATRQTEIIQTNTTEFRELILQKVQGQSLSEEKSSSKKQLYLIAEPNANDMLTQVQKMCEPQDVSVISPQFTDSIVDNLNTHYKNLIESDFLVIYYTNNNPIWLQTKLQDSFKVFGMGKKTSYKWKCILFHSPAEDRLVQSHVESFETFDFRNKKNAVNTFEKRLKEAIHT